MDVYSCLFAAALATSCGDDTQRNYVSEELDQEQTILQIPSRGSQVLEQRLEAIPELRYRNDIERFEDQYLTFDIGKSMSVRFKERRFGNHGWFRAPNHVASGVLEERRKPHEPSGRAIYIIFKKEF